MNVRLKVTSDGEWRMLWSCIWQISLSLSLSLSLCLELTSWFPLSQGARRFDSHCCVVADPISCRVKAYFLHCSPHNTPSTLTFDLSGAKSTALQGRSCKSSFVPNLGTMASVVLTYFAESRSYMVLCRQGRYRFVGAAFAVRAGSGVEIINWPAPFPGRMS